MKAHLVALSSAAVLTVYAAGYARTRTAAEQLEALSGDRRPPPVAPRDQDGSVPVPARGVPPARTEGRGLPPAPASAGTAEPVTQSARVESPAALPAVSTTNAAPRAEAVANRSAAAAAAAPTAVSAPAAPVEIPSGIAPTTAAAPPPVTAPTERPAAETPTPIAPAAPKPEKPEGPRWKDGHYYGMGYSRHGDIEASIWIEAGKITTASISKCLTRYPCDWIAKAPGQVVFRQSADVDFVSGATESVSAFYYAVLEALGKAQQ